MVRTSTVFLFAVCDTLRGDILTWHFNTGHVFHDACTLEFTRQLEFNPALARCPLCRVDGFDGFLILYLPIPPSMIAQQTLDQLNNDLAERASQLNTREAQLKAKEAKLKTWEQRLEVKQSSGRNNEGKTADQPKQRENASEDVQII